MIQIRNKINNKVYYFRFFSSENKNIFYFTPTIEVTSFDFGHINHFEPIKTTWDKLYEEK